MRAVATTANPLSRSLPPAAGSGCAIASTRQILSHRAEIPSQDRRVGSSALLWLGMWGPGAITMRSERRASVTPSVRCGQRDLLVRMPVHRIREPAVHCQLHEVV